MIHILKKFKFLKEDCSFNTKEKYMFYEDELLWLEFEKILMITYGNVKTICANFINERKNISIKKNNIYICIDCTIYL